MEQNTLGRRISMRFIIISLVIMLQACSAPQQVRLYQGPALGNSQEAELILPLNFEILSLDEQEIAQFTQTFRNQALNVKMTPGFHTLVMRYSDIWQLDADNHDSLSTGQLTFTGTFIPGEVFRIQTPPLNTYAQAKQFTLQPSVNLVSEHQTLTASHIAKADPLKFKADENIDKVTYPHLRQLKFWWLQANEYERQQFTQWLATPPKP